MYRGKMCVVIMKLLAYFLEVGMCKKYALTR
jgi:hypothetical protein